MTAELQVNAFAQEDFLGLVTDIAEVGSFSEGQVFYTVRIAVPNAPHLRSGMTASVQLLLWERESVLALPRAYVYTDKVNGEMISTVNRLIDGRLVPTTVRIGLSNGEMVEITEGLREGELVLSER